MENLNEAAKVDENQSVSPTETESVSETQRVAKRIKEAKEEARKQALEDMATEMGYENYANFMEAQTNNKLIEKGLDPEAIKPVMEEFFKNSPEYKEALKYKQEKEELEKKIWAQSELERLNTEMGTLFKDISELDEKTIEFWNKGLALEEAYAAANRKKIIKSEPVVQTGKDHMKPIPSSNGNNPVINRREPSKEELAIFKRINPNLSEEDFKKYLNR